MNQWISESVSQWTIGWMNPWINASMNQWLNEWMSWWIGWMDGWVSYFAERLLHWVTSSLRRLFSQLLLLWAATFLGYFCFELPPSATTRATKTLIWWWWWWRDYEVPEGPWKAKNDPPPKKKQPKSFRQGIVFPPPWNPIWLTKGPNIGPT